MRREEVLSGVGILPEGVNAQRHARSGAERRLWRKNMSEPQRYGPGSEPLHRLKVRVDVDNMTDEELAVLIEEAELELARRESFRAHHECAQDADGDCVAHDEGDPQCMRTRVCVVRAQERLEE